MARAKVQAGPDTLLADEIEAFFKDDFQYFIMFFNTLPQYLAIQQDMKNYQDAEPKSKILRDPVLQDPLHDIKCSDNLCEVIKYIETAVNAKAYPTDHPIQANLESLFALWTSACSLKQLDRFLSRDQPPLNATPLLDGDNLDEASVNPFQHNGFDFEQMLQKFTIRALHLPGVLQLHSDPTRGMVTARFLAIHRLCFMGRLLLQQEFNKVLADDADDFSCNPSNSSANWVRNSRKNIVNALEFVATRACFRPGLTKDEIDSKILDRQKARAEAGLRPLTEYEEMEERDLLLKVDDEKTVEQKLDENFAEKGFLFLEALQREMTERLMEETGLDPLLMDLIRRENDFESALAVENYEDKLITKQISLLDEQQLSDTQAWSSKTSVQGLNAGFEPLVPSQGGDKRQLKGLENTIFRFFHDMALVNRHRRDFRLLRDWAGQRPW
ncbi:hypothetical protein ACEPPN_013947 [Leptodophora sp. 'Broadleaf-Isolate-01']